MDGWMNEGMNEGMDARMDGWKNEWKNKWMSGMNVNERTKASTLLCQGTRMCTCKASVPMYSYRRDTRVRASLLLEGWWARQDRMPSKHVLASSYNPESLQTRLGNRRGGYASEQASWTASFLTQKHSIPSRHRRELPLAPNQYRD